MLELKNTMSKLRTSVLKADTTEQRIENKAGQQKVSTFKQTDEKRWKTEKKNKSIGHSGKS